MIKKEILVRFTGAAAILTLVLTACLPTAPRIGGIVQGVVYGDLNGSGGIDPDEGPLDGVQVTLADCGPTQNQVTAADGKFNFTNLPEGTCHVSVSKADWIFSGSYPSLTYPVPVASNPDLATAFSMFMAPVGGAAPASTDTPTSTAAVPTDTPTMTFTPTMTDTPTMTLTTTSSAALVTPETKDVNCRFGPGTAYLTVGALRVGNTVPILGAIADHSWWQIDNPLAAGSKCWVSDPVVTTSGDLSLVPILPVPSGLVTDVTISTPAVVHGACGGPNPTSFEVSITTNGPASVIYHLEIYNGDGTLRNRTNDATLTFASASTQTFDPGGAYKTDCGDFYIKVVVTSPNNKTAQANWSVVSP